MWLQAAGKHQSHPSQTLQPPAAADHDRAGTLECTNTVCWLQQTSFRPHQAHAHKGVCCDQQHGMPPTGHASLQSWQRLALLAPTHPCRTQRPDLRITQLPKSISIQQRAVAASTPSPADTQPPQYVVCWKGCGWPCGHKHGTLSNTELLSRHQSHSPGHTACPPAFCWAAPPTALHETPQQLRSYPYTIHHPT
jgi:hypothetical protein